MEDLSYRNTGAACAAVILVLVLAAVVVFPAAATDTPTANGAIPAKSDISNLVFANQLPGHYYFKFDQVGGGGLNALHISSGSSPLPNYGDVTTTTSQSGTFYVTDTGGRGYQDEAILLIAVKGEIPENFAIHIRSSGYSWTPDGTMNKQPDASQISYHAGAVDDTFTKSQFVYGPQTWKPAGNNVPSDYPLYYGQDMSDAANTFKLMFVDLKAGPLGPNGKLDMNTLTDKGAIRVEYTITNLDTVATFNTYAWNANTTQGKGISWSNGLTSSTGVPVAVSGYTVLGTKFADRASEFPTAAGSTPVYHAPDMDFTADVVSGAAPLTVKFSDTTPQSVKTWLWDFGDGNTSAEKNPVYTYRTPGKYTVSLTGTNGQGLSGTKKQTDMITVTAGSSSSGGASGASSGSGGSGDDDTSSTPASSGPDFFQKAGFSANATFGICPLAVQFSDTSSIRNATRWSWDFNGDGIPDSSEENPVFVFQKAGNYSVSLVVNTTRGTLFNLTMREYIQVLDTPSLASDVGWISSDSADPPAPGPRVSASPQVTADSSKPAGTTPVQGSSGRSPVGAKVAELLADAIIVVAVIGTGLVLWRKL